MIACLHAWYPGLAVAAVGYMLDPDLYATQVGLEGDSFDERPYVVVVESAGELVSCLLLAAEEHGPIVSGTMTVVSPSAYGKGLGDVSARVTVGVSAAIGADLAYAIRRHHGRPGHDQVLGARCWPRSRSVRARLLPSTLP